MRSSSFLLSTFVLALLLAGCDATSPQSTVILNANSPEPPTTEYTFSYDPSEAGAITVQSQSDDNLTSTLETNGFRRDDITSARVDSVKLERLSPKGLSRAERAVFDYLQGATVYLGSNTDGPRIAEASFQTTDERKISLPVQTADVTGTVKSGPTRAFLRLDTADESRPDRNRDRVRVTVYFRIEVRSV